MMTVPDSMYEPNPEWEGVALFADELPDWEAWQPEDEYPDERFAKEDCQQCGNPGAPLINPFSTRHEPICRVCMGKLLSDGEDDSPWRCGNEGTDD